MTHLRNSAIAIKKELERDFLLRRYHKLLEGRSGWDEKLIESLIRIKTLLVTSWRSIVKRILDVLVAVTGLALSFPIMLMIALAIKLTSKGPVLYKQARIGRYGKIFNILKFRTMKVDAEKETGPIWAKANDPRIIPIGLFLRKAHLDELPQFFNVLKGEMSVVGPRPERPYFVSEFKKVIPHYAKRLYAKPGITGLAQLKRHYDESLSDVKKKLRYDILYVQKMCPILDVKLIALTFGEVVFRTGR